MANDVDLKLEELSRAAMIELQQRLGIEATGDFEEAIVVKALREFQAREQLRETGELDVMTQNALQSVVISQNHELESILGSDGKEAAILEHRQSLSEGDWADLKAFFGLEEEKELEQNLVRSIVRYQIYHNFELTGQLSDGLRLAFGLQVQEELESLLSIEPARENVLSPPISGKITPNFTLSEFMSTGDKLSVPMEYHDNLRFLCKQLEVLRKVLGNRRIKIVSGWRSEWWNKRIGGDPQSEHLLGMAADFTVDGIRPSAVRRVLESLIDRGEIYDGGVGRYANYTHYDVGADSRRWNS
ncbi:MAG: D-Ala-D-Ala carboxypeptidase family metallohydrolase [Bradymonadales bacterium]